MNRAGILLLLISTLLLLGVTADAQPTYSDQVLDYQWFTESELTPFGEVIWFFNSDVFTGPVRSNDSILLRGSPIFYDIVVTTAEEFIPGPNANPQFLGPDPVFGADSLADFEFIDAHQILSNRAMRTGGYWDNEWGEEFLQSRIVADETGWMIFQWQAGIPFSEDAVLFSALEPYGNRVLYFEGRLEIFGTHVQGETSIGSSGTMFLMDDLLYEGLPARMVESGWNAFFEYDGPEHLTLVAPNIMVANTPANGRGNGGSVGPWTDHSNKHIRISARLVIPFESRLWNPDIIGSFFSFSFDNQNNSPEDPHGSDGYWWCDPEGEHANQTDERGEIFLYGSIAQHTRGYVHRSTCGGTGYDRMYAFDNRFPGTHLPGAVQTHHVDLTQGDVTWQDTSIVLDDELIRLEGDGILTLGPGTHIESVNPSLYSLFEHGRLRVQGSEEQPVVIEAGVGYDSLWTLTLFEKTELVEEIQFLRVVAPNVKGYFSPQVSNLEMITDGYISIYSPTGHTAIRDSHFQGLLYSTAIDTIERSLVEGQLISFNLSLADRLTLVYHPSISPLPDDLEGAIVLGTPYMDYSQTIRNTTFFGAFEKLVNASNMVDVSYCSWWGAIGEIETLFSDSVNVFEETVFEANPLFWNPERGDYHLREGSPLIDAGDPESPDDPDGSRADIGAFPYDPNYVDAPETDPETGQPLAFGIENLYPNPFNGMTTLSLTLPRSGEVEVAVFDLLGRQVEMLHQGVMDAGKPSLSLNLNQHPSGLYFVVARTGSQRAVYKAMLVK